MLFGDNQRVVYEYIDGFVNDLSSSQNGEYVDLVNSMAHDHWWIVFYSIFSFLILSGFMMIAADAYDESKKHDNNTSVNRAFLHMCLLFLLSGFSTFGFNLISVVWPAYKLVVILTGILCFVTWRFVFISKEVRFYEIFFSNQCDIAKMQKDLNEAAKKIVVDDQNL